MSHTALDNWQAPLPADEAPALNAAQRYVKRLRDVRDDMAEEAQLMQKDPSAGHEADLLLGRVDALCDFISEFTDGVERLAGEK